MSSRLYPIYQRGNPQLRIFLPNFWLKLVKPRTPQPPNVVIFHCSMGMTTHDIKNYLEKIYNVKTVQIRTRIQLGAIKRNSVLRCATKEDDIKVAYAILPKDEKFVFPDLVDKEDEKKAKDYDKKTVDEMQAGYKQFLKVNNKPAIPGWYSI